MSEQQRTFEIPEGLVSAILGYLGRQPYQQVNQLMNALSQTVQAQLTPEELAAAGVQQQAPSAPKLVQAE